MPREIQIALNVKNNLAHEATVPVFNGSSRNSIFQASNTYEWDLSGETFVGTAGVSIQSRHVTQGAFANFSKLGPVLSTEQVAAALNTLKIGVFLFTATKVYTYSDAFVYGDLSVL